jgi:polar amino acid transport system permease protein
MDRLRFSYHTVGHARRCDPGKPSGTLFLLLRLSGGRAGHAIVSGWVSLFRNTPLLVQLLFWYFAAWNGLPQAFRDLVNADHSWSILPGNVWWFTPEFLCSAWGLGVFTSAFLIEEVESGYAPFLTGSGKPRWLRDSLPGGFFVTSFCRRGLRTPGSPSLGSISI